MSLELYQNPVQNILYFKSPLENIKSISIYGIAGKQVINKNITDYQLSEVNIEPLKPGYYFLQTISNSGKIQAGKFIIE